VRYRVELNQTERAELAALLSKHVARKLKRAQILLAADAGRSDDDIATSVRVGGSAGYRTKRRFALGNLKAALTEEPRPERAAHDEVLQYQAFICLYTRLHRRLRPKPTCSNIFASARLRFTRCC
jgi:hypothetical protein